MEILDHPDDLPVRQPDPRARASSPARGPIAPRSELPGQSLALAAQDEPRAMTVVRIAETLQADEATMGALRGIGAMPGNRVEVSVARRRSVRLESPEGSVELSRAQAKQVIVAA